ncbi:hypothetical protein E1286_24105 [Nonomuraea terrae]|uniref:Uncharacterized protein n=1 Tax=Nonomuraea terrae TaxID=2530383 RepID=A0A4R4YMF7_9ACTN|nr:hypothetical protein [Nonomuraea terrae]TDD45404.1 hypothetical protein E1286_24105 [Nonomuraea terrae]
MTEKTFIIRATLDFEYKVKAENADEAAQMMHDGESNIGPGSCVGYNIEAVVSADKADYFWDSDQDERAKCQCGHLLNDAHTGRRYYDREKRTNKWPNACDEHGCSCMNGSEAVAEQPAAVSQ